MNPNNQSKESMEVVNEVVLEEEFHVSLETISESSATKEN
jgi:hypothetical protein